VSGVRQDKTPSPWGTYDQNGNAVEILDTLAPQPPSYNFLRNWHYYHGGVANAPAYQLEISGFGYFPADTASSRTIRGSGSVNVSSETRKRRPVNFRETFCRMRQSSPMPLGRPGRRCRAITSSSERGNPVST
jgi:hypothetical protein